MLGWKIELYIFLGCCFFSMVCFIYNYNYLFVLWWIICVIVGLLGLFSYFLYFDIGISFELFGFFFD